MFPFSQVISLKPQWVQPKTMQRKYELRANEALFAKLEFQSAWGSLAEAVSAEGSWTFKRVGFFSPRVTVRRPGEEMDIAVFHPKWTGTQGNLEFQDGHTFTWKASNFWGTRYSFLDNSDQPLVNFQTGLENAKLGDFLKSQARVEIEPHGLIGNDLPLLVLLGWYLIILSQEDSSATTAATTAAVM